MSQLNVDEMVTKLRDRLVNLATESCYLRHTELAEACRKIWHGPAANGGLVSDLWLELTPPSATATAPTMTLGGLADSGLLSHDLVNQLDRVVEFPVDRLLYVHQKEAIIQAESTDNGKLPAVVVTAGTGAGKTECFLLPILNRLFSNPRRDTGQGVRCILVYPMNALVNDQVERLRRWLGGQDRIRFFHFTSETPEDWKAYRDANSEPIEKQFVGFYTRQHARGREEIIQRNGVYRLQEIDQESRGLAPDILITNYSMLEYMLCRPQDQCFFGSALEAIVLDEAHLYTGTLAAEIALLLRRVLIRCNRKPDEILHVATSATLGDGNLAEFAAKLFDKEEGLVRVVRGQRGSLGINADASGATPPLADFAGRRWLQSQTTMPDSAVGDLLSENDHKKWIELVDDLKSIAPTSVVEAAAVAANFRPAALLHSAFTRSSLAAKLVQILNRRERAQIGEIAEALWDERTPKGELQTLRLLSLLASARTSASQNPLVPHRIHILLREPGGISLCLNPVCNCPDDVPRLSGYVAVLPTTTASCPHCKSRALPIWRCQGCGESVIAAQQTKDGYLPIVASPRGGCSPGAIFLGLVNQHAVAAEKIIWINPDGTSGTAGVAQVRSLTDDGNSYHCPNCGEVQEQGERIFDPLMLSRNLGLSVAAETVLAYQPPYSDRPDIRPSRGRRLLIFTDGRQGAARLGPALTGQHETQLVRALLFSQIPKGGDQKLAHLIGEEIAVIERKLEMTRDRTTLEHYNKELLNKKSDLARTKINAITIDNLIGLAVKHPLRYEFLGTDNTDRDWSQQAWFENAKKVTEDVLPARIRKEMARPFRGKFAGGLEPLGLVEIVYPGLSDDHAKLTPITTMSHEFPFLAKGETWKPLIATLLDTLRVDGCVTVGTEADDERYNEENSGGGRVGGFMTRGDFVGQQERARRRSFIADLLRMHAVAKNELKNAVDVCLDYCFESLVQYANTHNDWLEHRVGNGLRVRLGQLLVRRPRQLFQSVSTGHVFADGVPLPDLSFAAAFTGCRDLKSVEPADLDRDSRLGRRRKELAAAAEVLGGSSQNCTTPPQGSEGLPASGLWAREHTAQLSPAENRRLQNLFKSGAVNVLSSSTTLELGIDIGGLTSVLLTNVPPGKANYLQRAGRAGRRADGTAAVITFARTMPFDHQAFLAFDTYLERPLRVPTVMLHREKVARRHAHAFLLGEYFRQNWLPGERAGAMQAFGNVGLFCQAVELPHWPKNSRTRPMLSPAAPSRASAADFGYFLRAVGNTSNHELRPLLANVLHGCGSLGKMSPEGAELSELVLEAARKLDEWNSSWREDYDSLVGAWERAVSPDVANAIRWNCNALSHVTVIEELGQHQILPRYGFPIGLQKLSVFAPYKSQSGYVHVREETQFRLERSGLMALIEYSPGRTVVAGGKELRSAGLMKSWAGQGQPDSLGISGRAGKCKGKHFFYKVGGDLPTTCPICREMLGGTVRQMLSPRHGFATAWFEPPKQATEQSDSGVPQLATMEFVENPDLCGSGTSFGHLRGIDIRSREGGEMLVYNAGRDDQLGTGGHGFAICTQCGYAAAERQPDGEKRQGLPRGFDRHKPLTLNKSLCWQNDDEAPVLRNQWLFDKQITDIVQVHIPEISVLGITPPTPRLWNALDQALRLGGCRALDLDARDIGGIVMPVPNGVNIILYDNHPGGAGHVLELAESVNHGLWLEAAHAAAYVDKQHDSECETGCLRCLLTFDAGMVALDRRGALTVIDKMLQQGR